MARAASTRELRGRAFRRHDFAYDGRDRNHRALTIDARPLAANVTINANQLSRIFNITATTGDFTLGGLTLTGGQTHSGDIGAGGAIRSLTTGSHAHPSTVSGNSTTGDGADGGGIYAMAT